MRTVAILICLVGTALINLTPVSARAAPLDPNAYTALGTLTPTGDVTINTDTLTLSVAGGATYTGVMQSQGSGNPEIAVYAFSDVHLDSTVNVSVQGTRPLALLSQTDFQLETEISVRGLGYAFGEGPGAIGVEAAALPSYGGGFAGMGGGWNSLVEPDQYLYGDLRSVLEGGSAGGQGSGLTSNRGGGAIEIGAVGVVTISGPASPVQSTTTIINASGGNSSGGAPQWQPGQGGGGGILIHGATTYVDPSAVLVASGGDGSSTSGGCCLNSNQYRGAGGGGGGRITILAEQYEFGAVSTSGSLQVRGGNPGTVNAYYGSATGQPGSDGRAAIIASSTTINAGESAEIVAGLSGNAAFTTDDLIVESAGSLELTASQFSVHNLHGDGSIDLVNSTLTIGSGNGDSNFTGVIAGTGTLAKSGGGVLVLGGTNTFAGVTDVSGGTLRTSSLSTIGDVWNSATVVFDQDTYGTYAGNITGVGNFGKQGTGTLALTGNHQQEGTISVENGGLILQSGSLVASQVSISSGARMENSGGENHANNLANSGTYIGPISLSGAFTNLSTGEVRLGSGDSLVAQGLSPHSNSGLIDVVGGQIEFDGALTNAGNTGLIYGRNATMRFDGGLTNDGSLALSFGTSDIYGPIANQATGNIVVSGLSSASFLGDVSNEGNMQTGAGSTSVFFGTVTGSGAFNGTGQILMEGGFEPGNSPAEVYFGGDLMLGVTNTLTIELGGTTPGTGHDKLIVADVLSLGGILDLQLFGGYQPGDGDVFDVFDAASISGIFSQMYLPQLSNGLEWDTSNLHGAGVIQVVPEPSTALLLVLGLVGLAARRRPAAR